MGRSGETNPEQTLYNFLWYTPKEEAMMLLICRCFVENYTSELGVGPLLATCAMIRVVSATIDLYDRN